MTYQGFLPISKEDMEERGITQLDFVYVCGDAYVDHPSFGHAIISRLLEAHGYTVGIIAQPDWIVRYRRRQQSFLQMAWISGMKNRHFPQGW